MIALLLERLTGMNPWLALWWGVVLIPGITGLLITLGRELWRTRPRRTPAPNMYLGAPRTTPVVVHGAVTGWKVARLGLDLEGRLRFAGVSFPLPYGVDEDATCPINDHAAPTPTCTCGFHAYRDRAAAAGHVGGLLPILEVALSGEFVEYDAGWRTGHQRVTRVEFPHGCYCRRPAALVTLHERAPGAPADALTFVEPRCLPCAEGITALGNSEFFMSVDELRELLDAEVPPGRAVELVIPGEHLTTEEVETLRARTRRPSRPARQRVRMPAPSRALPVTTRLAGTRPRRALR